jgi:ubiquinone biosynthesis protein UbiJ
MRWPDPDPARLVNRIFADQDWARSKLAGISGRAFSIAVGPLSATWMIAADGMLSAAPSGAAPDLKLRLAPWSVPSFLADPSRWSELVEEEGDAQVAGVLKELAHTLPWFVEETFAKALGPIAGQRVADAGRRFLKFPEYAAQRLADSAGSYARDEAQLVARAEDARRMGEEIAAVAARVDALAQRIDTLAPKIAPIR